MLINGTATSSLHLVADSRRRDPTWRLRGRTLSLPRNGPEYWRTTRSVARPDQTHTDVTEFFQFARLSEVVSGNTQVVAWTVFGGGHDLAGSLLIQSGIALHPKSSTLWKSAVSVNRYSLTLILDDSDSLRVGIRKENNP